ncbi:hypothetical protein [Natrinema halophilum]|nr:hypothetical protein [Natrinema halophilum]
MVHEHKSVAEPSLQPLDDDPESILEGIERARGATERERVA